MVNKERRRTPRYRVDNIQGSILFRADATVHDVSVTGMKVYTSTQLRIGRPCVVTLGKGQKVIQVSGTVVRCVLRGTQKNRKGESELIYEAGINFHGMSEETAGMLQNFLQENIRIDMERKLTGCFIPESKDALPHETRQAFEISTLSLTGMRVVMGQKPKVGQVARVELDLGRHGVVRSHARVDEARGPRGSILDSEHALDIDFLNMGPDSRGRLSKFIADTVSKPTI